jgi:hypothetical protein
MNEVTYFECGHRTIWGQIGKSDKLRSKAGDLIHCRTCNFFQKVIKTVKEKP